MSLEITYWTIGPNRNHAGVAILSETLETSGTSAQSGPTPQQAQVVSILSTADNRFAYGANPTATGTAGMSGHVLAVGERVWIHAIAGHKIAGITAA